MRRNWKQQTRSGPTCGRPLGIGFHLRTKQLFVADAYQGFLVVAPNQTVATKMAGGADGVPFKLPTGLDVDQSTGNVYFTDASSQYSLSQIQEAIDAGDATGRLLKYDNNTKQVTVLLSGLSGAGGTSVSRDGSFVLVSEFIANRIKKFWLKGEFWVAVNLQKPNASSGAITNVPTGIKINRNGKILRTVDLSQFYGTTNISEFHQRNGKFYVGTLRTDFLGRLSI
ncbi:hypothetical protein TIFTF001_027082 [Ficus carica]|uniref:Strictosidine synthase conserved region domain-containing protein n=1 Tax=Ficus carica TaxID=3494 RepID=A0AA88IZQ4_FICCA|nr:hypothetical protein TIFTF001_027082 [Ficus carica]